MVNPSRGKNETGIWKVPPKRPTISSFPVLRVAPTANFAELSEPTKSTTTAAPPVILTKFRAASGDVGSITEEAPAARAAWDLEESISATTGATPVTYLD